MNRLLTDKQHSGFNQWLLGKLQKFVSVRNIHLKRNIFY